MARNIYIDYPNGVKLPALGYGTWQASGDILEKALEIALEAGYRHIDTAQAYANQDITGKVLKRWLDAGKLKREDLFITTTIQTVALFPDQAEDYLKTSLKKLQLDYVDLYLIHLPIRINLNKDGAVTSVEDPNHVALWKALEAQVDAGRTKTIGLSNFNIRQIEKILKNSRISPANLRIELHVYMQQRELVDYCKRNGITVVAYAPLGSPNFNNFMARRGYQTKDLPDILNNSVVHKIATKHSKTAAQVLLRYLIQLGVSAIPKSVTPARIRENIDIFDFELDDEDTKQLYDLEIGPSARICDYKAFKGASSHPEYPF